MPYYHNLKFPKEYPVGKDLDIIVAEKNIDKIRDFFESYSAKYKEKFDIICIDEKFGFRVRFEDNGLHFQFDVKYCIFDDKDFTDELYKAREYNGQFYITNKKFEVVVRAASYNYANYRRRLQNK